MAAIRGHLRLNNNNLRALELIEERVLFKTMDALKTDVIQSQVMPFDVGTMQNNSTFVSTSQDRKTVSLITRTPYAARLYYHPEYNFQTTNNANAKGQWLEDYITGSKKNFCKENFENFLRREL